MSHFVTRGRMAAFLCVLVTAPVLSALPMSDQAVAASCAKGSGLSGVVTAKGSPSTNVVVSVYADPDLSGVKVGQSIRMPRVGMTTTDRNGCWSIGKPNGAALARAADRFGNLDLVYYVQRPGGTETRNRPITIDVAATRSGTARAASNLSMFEAFSGSYQPGQSGGAAMTQTLGRSTADDKTTTSAATPPSSFLRGAQAPGVNPRVNDVRWKLLKNFGKRKTIVGQWWSRTPGVRQVWQYSQGASSEIGSAFSMSGKAGTFSQSQSFSDSVDATVTFPTSKGKAGKYFQSYFKVGLWQRQYNDWHVGWYNSGRFVRLTNWERGARVFHKAAQPALKASRCSHYDKGATDETAVSRALTWTNGVGLSVPMVDLLGSISLTSKTGFTTSARNEVRFIRKGRLCGVFGPLSSPGALAAVR